VRTIISVTAVLLVAIVAGCEDSSRNSYLEEELDALRLEKTQLTGQVDQAKAESEQLKEQVNTLTGLKDRPKAQDLYQLKQVKIGKYTNLYDKDKDGTREKLIVYLQPTDLDGDIIKTAGEVDIELWDLSKDSDQAKLSQWHVGADDLKNEWFASIMTINYRLIFDVGNIVKQYDRPLTVKVRFTDYLSGKVFEEQTTIKP